MASVPQPTCRDPTASVSPAEQAVFAQRKLEELYEKTYRRLWPHREAVRSAQEVLVWRRPVAATLLYLGIHWIFA